MTMPVEKSSGDAAAGGEAKAHDESGIPVVVGELEAPAPMAMARGGAGEAAPGPRMKVTLLSGFLGAGKTTLLKRILRLNDGMGEGERLRMAVIVNDMGEINLDAEEIASTKMVQEEAEMVEMHNGCICCTLRGDLLKTVKGLSEEGKFDYLVIESTGIGEPLPVAQTFTMDVDSMTQGPPSQSSPEEGRDIADGQLHVATDEKKSLHHYAKLDTLVTVVDGLNIYDVLGSIETLADADNISGMLGNTGAGKAGEKEYKLTPEQEAGKKAVVEKVMSMDKNVLQQLLRQRDMDTEGEKEELVRRLIDAFEKEFMGEMAQVDDRPISRLWLDQIEFANIIIVSKAAKLDDAKIGEIEALLQKLNPRAKIVVPREDKYGDLDTSGTILNTGLFNMAESQSSAAWQQELAKEHNPETEEYGISSMVFIADEAPFHPLRLASIMKGFGDYSSAIEEKLQGEEEEAKVTEVKGSSMPDVFRGVVRTKGHLWIANANSFPVHFQTAGAHIDMRPSDQPFLHAVVEKLEDEKLGRKMSPSFRAMVDSQRKIMEDGGLWTEGHGDKRSQLIFIGTGLDKELMRSALREALVTEEETKGMGGEQGWRDLQDPFYGGALAKAHFDFEFPDHTVNAHAADAHAGHSH